LKNLSRVKKKTFFFQKASLFFCSGKKELSEKRVSFTFFGEIERDSKEEKMCNELPSGKKR